MIRALIFDMDGTLIDSEKMHYRAWRQTLQDFGVHSFPFEDFVSYIGTSNERLAGDYILSHGLAADIESLVLHKQKIYLEMIPEIKPLPGVREILSRYHGRLLLAVASSSHCLELSRILDTLELSSYFAYVVGGDMVSRKKPDPEIYLRTMALLALRAEECVAFEDSESGIAAAKNAGMFGVAVPNSLLTNGDFSRADAIIRQIDQANDQLLENLASSRNLNAF